MPLKHSKSKKAFEHNIKAEMHAGKPQDQSLAIAYSIQRKAKAKKMAHGGSADIGPSEKANQMGVNKIVPNYDRKHTEVKHGQSEARYGDKRAEHKKTLEELRAMPKPKLQGLAEGGAVSAKSEKRPMPEESHNDSKSLADNRGNKPAHNDSWSERSTVKQAQKPSLTRLSQPKMVESGVIRAKLRSDEHDLMDQAAPSSPKQQPSRILDEKDAAKMDGTPDMTKPHTTRKAYAKGGEIDIEDEDHDAINHHASVDEEYGDGAENDEAPHDESPEDGDDMEETMPVDEFMSTNRMAPMLAEGGHIEEDEDNYADDGHEDSIAAAIMARRDRLHDEIDSGAHDEDMAAMMADGGEVDLSINADEEPNNEDQMSFEALRKENYSESEGLDDLGDQPEDSNEHSDEREMATHDKHDRVDAIMSKMKSKRQFKR